jgi:hypothetical protein
MIFATTEVFAIMRPRAPRRRTRAAARQETAKAH